MNAIIMAAGTSSRFVPLSSECPKGLLNVKGEILIERQIRQLNEAGVTDITIVVGYKAEMFEYLVGKFGVKLVYNEDYARYNNSGSLIRVIERLGDTFLCCSDNYFPENVFLGEPEQSYYSALYAEGETGEYCLECNANDEIVDVKIGGHDSCYMVGHVYFNTEFSKAFRKLMIAEYPKEETKQGYWEDLYIKHIEELPKLRINRYKAGDIQEFDSLDELREFDESYVDNTRSTVVKEICASLGVKEADVCGFKNIKHQGEYLHFTFYACERAYEYKEGNINPIEQ